MTKRSGRAKSWLLVAALLASVSTPALAELSTAVKRSEQPVPGLQAPAEIILDQWGIPHIYAGSTRDAIFLQGYNAARDLLLGAFIVWVPAAIFLAMDGTIVQSAEGWQPGDWRKVVDQVAQITGWRAPMVPLPKDPAPFAGSPV